MGSGKTTNIACIVPTIDNRLCMVLSSSPYIFSRISDFLVRCVHMHVHRVINYLADFCILSHTKSSTMSDQFILIKILYSVGFHINYKNVSPTSTYTKFLGIYIDSSSLQLILPEDKIAKMTHMLYKLKSRRKTSHKELERVGG